jgi:hypothetical protein
MENITLGKRYPLSILSSSQSEKVGLTTFQYVFKPSSIDTNKPGICKISDSNEVVIDLPTSEEGKETESFKGTATKPSNECILSFHDDRFELEKVSTSMTNIRHRRNESTFAVKDVSNDKGRKFLEQTLQMRAGPIVPKRKREKIQKTDEELIADKVEKAAKRKENRNQKKLKSVTASEEAVVEIVEINSAVVEVNSKGVEQRPTACEKPSLPLTSSSS